MDLRVLGPLQATEGDRDLALGSRLSRTLMALLASQAPASVDRETLVDQIWGERPPATARNIVQVYVSQLRKLLGRERIVTQGTSYALVLQPDELDAWRFATLITDGGAALDGGDATSAADLLGQALDLWRGPAYAGMEEVPLLAAEARRLEESRLLALETRIEADLQCGHGAGLVPELVAMTEAHPLRERAWAHLVRALYSSDRQAEALEALRRVRRFLSEELGVDPGPELAELEQAVLQHDPQLKAHLAPALPPLPPELSTPGPKFVGRGPDLAWLLGALDRVAADGEAPDALTVVIEGEPGSGKTRLVAEVAKVARARGARVTYASGLQGLAALATQAVGAELVVVDEVERLPAAGAPELSRLLASRAPGRLTVLCVASAWAPLPLRVVLSRAVEEGVPLRHLEGLSHADLCEIAATYAPGAPEDEVAAFASGAPTDPRSAHESASAWAVERAGSRRDAAAAALPASAARLRQDHEEAVAALLDARRAQALHRANVDPGQGHEQTLAHEAPYRGLAAYAERDAVVFFGRDRLVAEVLAALIASPVVLVVGPSGAGKSSLARAGVVPAVRAGALPGSDRWQVEVCSPSRLGPHPDRPPAPGLLVLDQFEEVFTTLTDEERGSVEDLVAAAQTTENVRLLITLRSDFFPRVAELPRLREAARDATVLVGPMGPTELRQVIEQPALLAGLQLEPGLSDEMLADVRDQAGALPLLSTALLSLWGHRDGDKLTRQAYATTGGVAAAIRTTAENAYLSLDPSDREVARRLLLRLAEVVEPQGYVRRRVPLSELGSSRESAAGRVVDGLARSRILTITDDAVEVAHESLFTQWPRYRGWLDLDEEGRRLRTSLTPAAAVWAASGRRSSDLYRGPRLVAAWEYAATNPADLTDLEREFVQAGHVLAERERLDQQRRVRRLRVLAGSLGVALICAVVAGAAALRQGQEAMEQEAAARASSLRADSRRVAAQALLEQRPDTQLLMAAQGLRLAGDSDTRATMLQLRERYAGLVSVIDPSVDSPWDLSLSADGQRAAITGSLDSAAVVDLTSGVRQFAVGGTLSPDGRILAVEGGGRVLIQALDRDPPSIATLRVPGVFGLAFAGGRLVVARTTGEQVSLDSYALGSAPAPGRPRHLATIPAPPDRLALWQAPAAGGVVAAASPPNRGAGVGARVSPVVVSANGTVRRGRSVLLPTGATRQNLALRPDGQVLAVHTGSALTLRDARTGRLLSTYPRPSGPLVWSPDGRLLAQGGPGAAVFAAEGPDTLSLVDELTGHRGDVTALAFTADGNRLWTTGDDGQLLGWDPSATDSARVLGPTPGARSIPVQDVVVVPSTSGPILRADLVRRDLRVRLCPRSDPACSSVPALTQDVSPPTRVLRASAAARGDRYLVETYETFGPRRAGVWHLLDASGEHVTVPAPLRRTQDQLDLTHSTTGTGALLSPDGATVVSLLGAETLGVWTTDPLRLDHRLPLPDGPLPQGGPLPQLAAFTADSQSLLVNNQSLYVMDLASGAVSATLQADGPGLAVAISPDGARVAVGDTSGQVRLWSTRTWRPEPTSLEPHPGPVTSASFSGDVLLTASRSEVRMFDLGEAAPATERLEIPCCVNEPDVAGVGQDTVIVSGVGIAGPFQPHWWDLDPPGLIAWACSVAGRDLTVQEWQRVLPGRTQRSTCP